MNVDPGVETWKGRFKPRVESLYGHHIGRSAQFTIPQEVVLYRGDDMDLAEALAAQVRYNARSPWRLTIRGDQAVLTNRDRELKVGFFPYPSLYDIRMASGLELWRLVQHIGPDLVGLVPSNYCALFSTKEHCRFCEIMPAYQHTRTYPRSIKPVAEQQESLTLAMAAPETRFAVVTTGNLDLENHRSVENLISVFSGVRKPDHVRTWAFFMPPRGDFSVLDQLRQAGVDCVGFNLEVWREDLYPVMVPGKARYLGRDGFLAALEYAVGVFGAGNVFTNLPYGIQSLDHRLDPASFDPDRENEICSESLRQLLDIGVLATFTIYHTTGDNQIGPIKLDLDRMLDFLQEHGRLIWRSGIVPPDRNAIIFGLGSIANHFYNEYYYLAKTQRHGA